MPRHHRSSLFQQLAALPWKSTALLAIGGFAVYYWALPAMLGKGVFGGIFSTLARSLAWLILLVVGLISLTAWRRQSRDGTPRPPSIFSFDRPQQQSVSQRNDWRIEPLINPPDLRPTHDGSGATRPSPVEDRPDTWSIEVLQRMDWKSLELVSAAYYECRGFRTQTTPCGADGGIDVTLYRPNSTEPFGIVQCKSWNSRAVGIKPLRELLGVMVHNKVAHGIFIATGSYTDEALSFAKANGIKLGTGETLLASILTLNPAQQAKLLDLATQGEWTTPSCASCGTKMVHRSGKSGDFWGCRSYPRCRNALTIAR